MMQKFVYPTIVLSLLVIPGALASASVLTDVSLGERSGMQQLYAVNDNQFDFNDAYTVDNSGSIATGSFTRVGYYLELGPAGNTQWVWASMDTFNNDPLLVGVPRAGTNIVENGTLVSNLNIESNHPNLAGLNGQTGQNGIIEFWASNYYSNGGGAFNSNDGAFDWKDSGGSTGGGHGSFQVFHLAGTPPLYTDGIGTTLFGVTANGGSGIGDQANSSSPDWTFGPGTGNYQVRNLEIWVGTSTSQVVPEPTTIAIWSLLGGIGLVVGHRRRRRKTA